jgi:hypothetical protein
MITTIYLKMSNLSLHNKWPARALLGEVNSQSSYPSSTCGKVGSFCELFWQHTKRKLFRIAKYKK